MTPSSLERQFLGKAAELLPLMEATEVTDVLVNGLRDVYVERKGRLERLESPFPERQALFDFIERLILPIGRRIDASQPYLDGRLADGSRFHVIFPPIAPEGPLVSIRKHRSGSTVSLESFGPPDVVEWLRLQIRSGRNLLISGGTGAGKTTLLSRLLDELPEEERVLIIEESMELKPRHPHVLHLEARLPTPDGVGEVTLRSLVRNALRMRPDRLILGECRGGEALDLLQAMNTGHGGSLCTIHANGPVDALRRLEGLALLSGPAVSPFSVRDWVAAAVHGVVHLERKDGVRRVREIVEVRGLEGERYRILPVGKNKA